MQIRLCRAQQIIALQRMRQLLLQPLQVAQAGGMHARGGQRRPAGLQHEAQFNQLISDHEGRGPEKLAPGTRALHIDFVDGVGTSKLTSAFIEKRLGCKGTARNVRSIKRIIEKLG